MVQTGNGVVSGAEHCGHVREVEVAYLLREDSGAGVHVAVRSRRRAEEEEGLDTGKDDDLGKAAVSARRNMTR